MAMAWACWMKEQTHGLRAWKTREEWEGAAVEDVHLADGSSTKMRCKPRTTLLAKKGTPVIAPVGEMAEAGYGTHLATPVEAKTVAGCNGGGRSGTLND